MKRFLLPLVAMLGAFAFADTGDVIVANSLTGLRSNAWFRVSLTGTEVTGATQRNFQTELWWQSAGYGTANGLCQLECSEWSNGVLTNRTVGDGVTMWAYDVARNQYNVATYGAYGGAPPATYVHGAIEAFKATANGPTAYLARLLSDTFGFGAVQYTPWMKSNVSGEASVTDVGLGYVAYDIGNPIYRWIRFTVAQDAFGNYQLNAFDLRDVAVIAGVTRTTTWVATVDTTSTPPSDAFQFKAPAGSRPIVGKRSGT